MQDNTINPQNDNPATKPVVGPPPDITPTMPTEIPPVPPPSPTRRRALVPTILGLVLLVVGVGAGILLVQQQQIFKQKAANPASCAYCAGLDQCPNPQSTSDQAKGLCGGLNCCSGWNPGTAPASCATSGAPCSTTCQNGRTFYDACPGDGSFASCTQWATQACATVGSVPQGVATPTPTPSTSGGTGGTTGGARCPSNYIYCAGSINGCMPDTQTCTYWLENINSSTGLTCPQGATCQVPAQTVGSISCFSSTLGRIRCCTSGSPSGGACPGFSASTSGTGGTTLPGAGQSCEPSGTCKTGFVCQGTFGSRVCQQQSNTASDVPGAICTNNGGTCGSKYIAFHCTSSFGDKCSSNPRDFTDFNQAVGYAAGCGQVDQVWSGGPCDRHLCGAFSIYRSSCATVSQPPATTTTTTTSAQCSAIKAYDTNWNPLTSTQLSQLKAGDKVRFTVTGTTTSGVFDKARFTINGTLRPEVTTVKPVSTQEFYDEYTIPAGTTNFTITSEIHHAQLGTWN